jgi:coenzyme F420-reducing hydrogenase delta subunit
VETKQVTNNKWPKAIKFADMYANSRRRREFLVKNLMKPQLAIEQTRVDIDKLTDSEVDRMFEELTHMESLESRREKRAADGDW